MNSYDSHTKRTQDEKNASGKRLFHYLKSLASESKLTSVTDSTTDVSTVMESRGAEKSGLPLLRLYGKLENNFHLSNKKALFMNMKLYYEALN